MDIFTQYGIMASVGEAGIPMYELLYDSDVSATLPATQLDITGLNITKDDEVRMVYTFVGDSSSTSTDVSVYPNDLTTATNYYRQTLQAYGTTVNSPRQNNGIHFFGRSTIKSSGFVDIKVSNNNRYVAQSQFANYIGVESSSFGQYNANIVGTQTVTSITKLSIVGSRTNGIAPGSRFQLYKLNKAWKSIQDYTVPSNTTSVTLNSFGTITKDDFIKINITTPSNASGFLSLLGNSSSSSNYHMQQLFANGTSVSASSVNANQLNSSSGQSNIFVLAKLSQDNKLNIFSNQVVETSSVYGGFNYITSSGATFPSGINSLTFTSTTTNGIGAGTRIQIYKLQAEKVADITVGSNTTQVDISNLNIKRNAEYLLMSDIDLAGTSGSRIYLNANGNTTQSNYYSAQLQSYFSTIAADRLNEAMYTYAYYPNRSVSYTHIKLSEIGAFTWQGYGNFNNASDIRVMNFFGSSTTENITSVTELNIGANIANAIGAGSRFTLYKLYEPEPEPATTYELLYDSDVSATLPATQIDITGLNITKDDELRMVCTAKLDNTSPNTDIFWSLQVNDITTGYTSQHLYATGTSTGAERTSTSYILIARYQTIVRKSQAVVDIKVSNNDRFVYQSAGPNYGIGAEASNLQYRAWNGVNSNTVSTITKLSVVASGSNGIGPGSRIRLYKVNKGAA